MAQVRVDSREFFRNFKSSVSLSVGLTSVGISRIRRPGRFASFDVRLTLIS